MIDISSADHYRWGDDCDGWHLVRANDLSVIEERMPPGSSEVSHHHERSRQFFYVLAGVLTIESEGVTERLSANRGREIRPRAVHRVWNDGPDDARFLVVSAPPSHGDRVAA